MSLMDEPPLRELSDRAIRQSLRHPEHLRSFLGRIVPDLAPGFDCSRARLLDREFPLDDWRSREADLPFEVPYRLGDEDLWALVCIFIEHQSDTDALLPLRLLYFASVYWDKQWHEWTQLPRPRPSLRLRPVLPLVLYTGTRPWGSNRALIDLLGEPEAFHAFAPRWEPIFWNLADQTPEGLLQTGEAWLQALAVIRAENADTEAFRTVFAEAVARLKEVHGRNPVQWYDLMRIVLTWAVWRRPVPERQPLLATAQAADADVTRQREVQKMSEEMGVYLADIAFAKGKAEGKVEELKETILELGRKVFGEPDDATQEALASVTELDRLKQLRERFLDVDNWQDLLQG